MENTSRKSPRRKGILFPIVLVVLGTIFLLERHGLLDRHVIWQWLPLLPVCVGALMLLDRIGGKGDQT
ncbi:MAG TPA: DUF5668 domain-containing protein [Noviherbaspirillum sp.]|uniref:LiaI-LiaF-like domain-containing protein n=1 Tax=Noviherbaspirillum sp. TaxID=1926288 RepID=UPI002B4A8DF1|nr:DUF5668 domain-containing protein [Noviherbaspirillum sp.]HJV83915.1 DUF5668 domain-containing protein [Noviherbaspirillum sp.]